MTEATRVLLIDDSEVVLELAREVLERAGMEVHTRSVAYGSSWEIVRLRPDVVLVDVNMPGLSGSDIVSVTRARGDLHGTRVLLFSAQPPENLETLALDCGADGWIHKTADQEGLVDSVRRWTRAPAPVVADRRHARVVFVDPAPDVTSLYREVFERQLAYVEFLGTGTEALARLRRTPRVDLVVAELQLAGVSGPDLYRRLLDIDEGWARRFLFVTGADAREPWVGAFVSTFRSRVLFKPVSHDDIRSAVSRRLDLLGV